MFMLVFVDSVLLSGELKRNVTQSERAHSVRKFSAASDLFSVRIYIDCQW